MQGVHLNLPSSAVIKVPNNFHSIILTNQVCSTYFSTILVLRIFINFSYFEGIPPSFKKRMCLNLCENSLYDFGRTIETRELLPLSLMYFAF